MQGNKRFDTRPELALRSALHARGFRFRRELLVALPGRRPARIDIAFTRVKLAVLVDGCFWHSCPEHATMPGVNRGYWAPKLARNTERDRQVDEALIAAGWTVVRCWEHEAPADAAVRVADAYHHRDLLLGRTRSQPI